MEFCLLISQVEAALFHCESWQCKSVLLGCCHDAGYAPFLSELASDGSKASKITLLKSGDSSSVINHLGLSTTTFRGLFVSHESSHESSNSPRMHVYPYAKIHPLEPIARNKLGLRLDRPLEVIEAVVIRLRKADLCHWYFLVGQCRGCSRVHDPVRQLSTMEFEALWYIARQGECYNSRRKRPCDDVKCIYGHRP